MSDEVEAYPLTWPMWQPRTSFRSASDFDSKVTIGTTRDQVVAELARFGASNVVISSNMQLRMDCRMPASRSQSIPAWRSTSTGRALRTSSPATSTARYSTTCGLSLRRSTPNAASSGGAR